jgi:hypothetical protein
MMAQQIHYDYRCPACGNSGGARFPDDSHDGETATCGACGDPVSLALSGWYHPKQIGADAAIAAWHDLDMRATYWWERPSIEPGEAALLLCHVNPLKLAGRDPVAVVNDAGAYHCLLDVFEGVQKDDPGVRRTLSQWRAIARQGDGFAHDPWLDEWTRAAGIEGVEPDAPDPATKGPPPLQSPLIADLFARLHGWDADSWKRNLADPPKWLAAARTTRGDTKSRRSATWNPVTIAIALAVKKVPRVHLERLFEHPSLAAWRSEWQDKREYLP